MTPEKVEIGGIYVTGAKNGPVRVEVMGFRDREVTTTTGFVKKVRYFTVANAETGRLLPNRRLARDLKTVCGSGNGCQTR
jgi:hypothetical protein